MSTRARSAVAGVVGLLAGAALTAGWLGDRPVPSPPGGPAPPPAESASPAAGDVTRRLEALAAALDAERDARRALAEELAALRARLPETEAEAPDAADPEQAGTAAPDGSGFDAEGLRELRLTEGEIDRLRERYDALALEELYLRNRAARDGWARRPRFFQELRALRQEARADLGDDDYDCLLYASGRNNRAIVAGVLPNSPAERAGVRRGDAIVSYAGERVFAARALTRATAAGEAGEQTEVRVRDATGGERRIFVPRGPLGVRLRPDRRPCDRG